MTESSEQIVEIRKLKIARLKVLEEQAATFGFSCPPEIKLEVESLRTELFDFVLYHQENDYFQENSGILTRRRRSLDDLRERLQNVNREIRRQESRRQEARGRETGGQEAKDVVLEIERINLQRDIEEILPSIRLIEEVVQYDNELDKMMSKRIFEIVDFVEYLIEKYLDPLNISGVYSEEYDIAIKNAKRYAILVIDKCSDKFIEARAHLCMAKILLFSGAPKRAIAYCNRSIECNDLFLEAYDISIKIWNELVQDNYYKNIAKHNIKKAVQKRREVKKQLKI